MFCGRKPWRSLLARRSDLQGRGEDLVGRGHVLFEQDRLEGEHVADVVETVADVVGGELLGGLEVHAAEVADGVVVLGAVEPPDGDAAGVRGPPQSTLVSVFSIQFEDELAFRPCVGCGFFGGAAFRRPPGHAAP